ncbi:MAG: hypothetical protein EPO28_10410 [Saprospiraceae bacterium]|nr:MAG: hypothetical protein EPO28_10410 [Saprospiraceae bacterium]
MQKAREDAQAQWDAFKANLERKLANSSAIQDRSDGREIAPCNCSFRFEDVQIQTPPEHSDFEIDFLSTAECVPNDPWCYYYSSFYFSGPYCGTINNPNCFDDWTGGSLPPSGYRPFNCQVPAYSTFPVFAGSIWVDEGCGGGDGVTWSITFRVVCQETEANLICGPGGGYGFVSDPITLSGSGSNYYHTTQVQLQECGCDPVEIQ